MNMKKFTALALTSILAFSLAACGGASSSSAAPLAENSTATSGESGGTSSSDATIKLAVWDKVQEEAVSDTINEWSKTSGIKVSVEVTPWDQYWTMLEASATGGSMPDVFWMHINQVQRYGRNDMLMDLTDRIAASDVVDMSKFPADVAGIYNIEGKQIGIPKDLDTIALWYNKTMFDEANVSYPDNTWTWDDLSDAAQKLTKDDGSQYGFVVQGKDNQSGYWNFIYQNGGYVINEEKTQGGWTNPKTLEAMEYFASFVEKGIAPDAVTVSENEVAALLLSGKVAMGFQGSWMLGELGTNEYIAANFDCAVMPAANDGTKATIYNGLGWSAAANTAHPEEVWQLMEYLGSEEAQIKMGEAGTCNIPAHEAGQAAWAKSDDRFALASYVEQIPYGVLYPNSINTVVWENMTKEKASEMLQGKRPVAEICAEMQTEMDKMLAEETA